jgi:hypothetical protein
MLGKCQLSRNNTTSIFRPDGRAGRMRNMKGADFWVCLSFFVYTKQEDLNSFERESLVFFCLSFCTKKNRSAEFYNPASFLFVSRLVFLYSTVTHLSSSGEAKKQKENEHKRVCRFFPLFLSLCAINPLTRFPPQYTCQKKKEERRKKKGGGSMTSSALSKNTFPASIIQSQRVTGSIS